MPEKRTLSSTIRDAYMRPERHPKLIASIAAGALALSMAGGAVIGLSKDDEESALNFNEPAKIIDLNHQPRKSWVIPAGKVMVPYFEPEKWEVAVEQCESMTEDCVSKTLEISEAEYQELEVGEMVIPSELVK